MVKLNPSKRIWLIREREQGEEVSKICASQRISRTAFYKLWNVYQQRGWYAVQDKSSGRKPDKIPKRLAEKVIKLRQEQGFGPARIEYVLNRQLSHNKIYKILVQNKLVQPNPYKARKREWIRFEREHSNSMWQVDFKWIESIEKWLCAYIDDHSRLVTAASYIEAATTKNALWLLEEGVSEWGKPREILSDHGTQFYAVRGGTSSFTKSLKNMAIGHILSSIKHPQTTGKIERWFGTYSAESCRFSGLSSFVKYYNIKRPHMSLGYQTPIVVFERDLS